MYIQQTEQWIRSFVIKLNLCPFAKREMDKESVRFQVSDDTHTKPALEFLLKEIKYLNETPDIETSLLIFPFFLKNFYEYLDFADKAQSLLLKKGFEGIYQIATFHPQYCFANAEDDDVTNYTNRSPYPTLHILREKSLEKAIAAYGNTEKIPENNITNLRKKISIKHVEKV